MRGFTPPKSDDEQLLVKRVRELAGIAEEKGIIRNTGFLSDRQQELALAALTNYNILFNVYGGYENAERKIFVFGSDIEGDAASKMCCISVRHTFSKISDTTLTHRDFLGAFLSLGLKREVIGDILPTNNGCALFAIATAAPIIINELQSVGKYEMRAQLAQLSELDIKLSSSQICSATLSSLRLDAIIAAMLKISRSSAQQLISSKSIAVNHIEISSAHYDIQENDVFTVKGYGKFKLCEIGGKSRKDRIYINYKIY